MLTQVIKRMVLSADTREDFNGESRNTSMLSSKRGMELAAAIVTFVVVILILSVVGKYLWNAVLAGESDGAGEWEAVDLRLGPDHAPAELLPGLRKSHCSSSDTTVSRG